MAKVTTRWYSSENLDFQYTINVNVDGKFYTTLPEDVTAKLKGVGIELKRNTKYIEGYFIADTLGDLIEKVTETVDNYSKKELVEEKIIIKYVIDTCCSYCRGKNGAIYPNGYWQKEAEGGEDYNWIEGTKETNAYNQYPFGFEVFFELKKVKIWKFPNDKLHTEYMRLEDSDTKDDNVMHWLHSIKGMGNGGSDVKEIDYTPELGLFFKNIILYICKINEKIQGIFGDDLDLSKIDLKQLPLLGFNGGVDNVR